MALYDFDVSLSRVCFIARACDVEWGVGLAMRICFQCWRQMNFLLWWLTGLAIPHSIPRHFRPAGVKLKTYRESYRTRKLTLAGG